MKKKVSQFFYLIAILFFVFAVSSCSQKRESPIIGKWGSAAIRGAVNTIEFRSDGAFIRSFGDANERGIYKLLFGKTLITEIINKKGVKEKHAALVSFTKEGLLRLQAQPPDSLSDTYLKRVE